MGLQVKKSLDEQKEEAKDDQKGTLTHHPVLIGEVSCL